MPVDDAELSATWEPSGEIRLRLVLPDKHGRKKSGGGSYAAKAAGCGALVYSGKVREKPRQRAGHGALPRVTMFGSAGRRMVRNGCGVLETRYCKSIVFLTLTLPGSTQEAREALARYSGKVIELVTHWIHYTASESDYVYVWEHQKSGALHMHMAIANKDMLKLRSLERGFKVYVHQLFSTLSRLASVDMFARSDGGSWRGNVQVLRSRIEPVRKSVKRYMSKYLTKAAAAEPGYCPSRWWGMSKSVRALVGQYRCCIRRKTSSWAAAAQLMQTVRELAAQTAWASFAWSQKFSPSSGTLAIYPPETEIPCAFWRIKELLDAVPSAIELPCVVDGDGLPVQFVFESGGFTLAA